MSRSLPVRALSMHQRDIIVAGHPIPAATIFPFFDFDGTVFYLLIVDPVSGELTVCKPQDVKRFPWFKPIKIRHSAPISHSNYVDKLSELLHFDPWWLLTEAPFCDYDYVSVLKMTNCVYDFDKDVTGLYFNGKLQQVTSSYVHTGENYSTKKFIKHKAALKFRHGDQKAAHKKKQETNSQHQASGWRLEPFWQSNAKPTVSSWGSDS